MTRAENDMCVRKDKNSSFANTIDILISIYIGLPIVIFILGWIRWYIAIPVALLIILSFFLGSRKAQAFYPVVDSYSKKILIGAGIVICVWVFFSGIGGFAFQFPDHLYRNQIFKLLVERDWPVQKEVVLSGEIKNSLLCYYIGFWMPAALFGKVFGLNAGFVFQYFWAVIGVVLVYVKISQYLKRWGLSTLILFIFFSGLDIVGCLIKGIKIFPMPIVSGVEWWASGLQYSCHSVQLFWVFNQAIYGWLLTLCILNEADNKRVVLIWSCGLFTCTFPFVGMIPFLVYKCLANIHFNKNQIKHAIKNLFSFENIIGGGLIGILSFLYLFGNTSAGNTGVGPRENTVRHLAIVFLFVFLEAGVYYLAILKFQKRNVFLHISMFMLIICPFIRVGVSADFCMRASIPSLLVLCILVIDSLHQSWKTNRKWFAIIMAIYMVGTVTVYNEIAGSISETLRGNNEMKYAEDDLFLSSNFSSITDEKIFNTFFLKK